LPRIKKVEIRDIRELQKDILDQISMLSTLNKMYAQTNKPRPRECLEISQAIAYLSHCYLNITKRIGDLNVEIDVE